MEHEKGFSTSSFSFFFFFKSFYFKLFLQSIFPLRLRPVLPSDMPPMEWITVALSYHSCSIVLVHCISPNCDNGVPLFLAETSIILEYFYSPPRL